MPIKPENRQRYPRHWKTIRAAILNRARHCCEFCGIPDGVYRNHNTGQWTDDHGLVETWSMDGDRTARVVLTIAHLDHTPENCDPANLRAYCQRCHLAYDATHHAQTAYQTRRAGKAKGDLFSIEATP
mgnify:CR=1 FL=1|jgi:5-methylcytosine-specific restriction endonuclease McrA